MHARQHHYIKTDNGPKDSVDQEILFSGSAFLARGKNMLRYYICAMLSMCKIHIRAVKNIVKMGFKKL